MKAPVVDDSSTIPKLLIRALSEFKITDAAEAADAMEAVTAVKTGEFDIVLIEKRTPNKLRTNFLRRIRAEAIQLPVIMVAMKANKLDVIKAIKVTMKTLIVDNEEADRVALQEILLDCGDCDFAENGREAVNAFQRAWSGGDPYDLVCLDIQMPILDGFETLRILRQMEKAMSITDAERCRIFMITADAGVTIKDQARALGCDAYFLKPIKRVLFKNRLQTFALIP